MFNITYDGSATFANIKESAPMGINISLFLFAPLIPESEKLGEELGLGQ